MKTETLTPKELRDRLIVVPNEFEKVLTTAEKQNVKVIYYSTVTPFGTYPMAIELENKK